MDEDTIEVVEVQDTQYGLKAVLQSPYDAKAFIQITPWKPMSEELSEYGSIRAKGEEKGLVDGAIRAAEDFGFSDDFATHATWSPDALGPEDGAWMIDTSAWDEASEFFEFAGFETSVRADVNL
jgi:hypothetical protein